MLDLPGIPKRHNPNVLGLQASLNDTLRRVGVFQASINDTLRGFEVSWLNGLSIPLNPTVPVRPSSCAKAAGPRRQSSANASIHVAPARSKSPATTTGPKTSTTEPLRKSSCAKDACPRHQRNVNRGSKVKRVAKVRELSPHTPTTERRGQFFPRDERKNK